MPLHNSPKLYLDEHLSPRLAIQLRKYGFDAVCAKERNMLSKEDDHQLKFAVSEKRALVTCNFCDFVNLDQDYSSENMVHWGIILTTEVTIGTMLNRLLKMLNLITADGLKNQVRWLNEFK